MQKLKKRWVLLYRFLKVGYNKKLMLKPQIPFSDFSKLDLRVGKVIEAEEVEQSEKLIKLKVDLGEDYKVKTIFAGMKGIVKINDLVNKKFIFVANIEPRKMMNEESQGMMLASDFEGKPVLITIQDHVLEGTIIR